MSLSCIAIDDEPLALEVIKSHVEKIENLQLKATFTKPMEGLAFLQENNIDLVLLDINMPDLDGINLARLINTKTEIVFTTAYSEYATEGFNLAATDYLLKPIRFERFLKMIGRVEKNIGNQNHHKEKSLFVKDGSKWIRIDVEELLFLKASDNYVVFQERNQKIMIRMTLAEAASLVPESNFLKTHRSYIINFSQIKQFEKNMVEIDNFRIPVSKNYQNSLLEKINSKQ